MIFRISIAMALSPVFAASNWLFGILLSIPGLAVLFFLALITAQNALQRIVNFLAGFVGSFGGLIVLGRIAAVPKYEWIMDGNSRIIVGPIAVGIGATIGIMLSVIARVVIQRGRRAGKLRGEAKGTEIDSSDP